MFHGTDKPHLPTLLKPDQNGYMKGRYINEAIRLLKDIIDYTDREKKGWNYNIFRSKTGF